ncbi:hypothetical protein C4577_01055 [Candidatus Parcubacteria bacterium]|nr:MAG: hypothetical protein C4577_01055 [Candidatus Parcubacteria bacterium]
MAIYRDRSLIISIFIIIIVTVITFWHAKDIFFQQDEWLGLGKAISRSDSGGLPSLIADLMPGDKPLVRLLPLTSIFNYIVFNLFGLKMWAYGVMSLGLAIINASIIYLAIRKLSKSSLIALGAALFWVTSSLSSQAITWIGAVIPSQMSLTAFLGSLYFMLIYLDSVFKERRWLIFSIILMVVSLSFKESGIYYLITFPLLIWFLKDKLKDNFLARFKTMLLIVLPVFLVLIMPRLLSVFNHQTASSSAPTYFASSTNVIYNAFLLPARSAFHVFLPVGKIYENIYSASRVHYAEDAGLGGCAVECLIGDSFSLMVSFYIIVIILLTTLLINRDQKKIVLISLASFFASLLPFILYQNRTTVLEIRYYIFPTLWMGVILSSICYYLLSKIPKFRLFLMLVIFVPLIAFNIMNIRKGMEVDVKVGEYRRQMLQTVTEIKPDLQKDNVFYFFTDNTGFYEFQSGFGQTLAVWFYNTGKIPKEALTDFDFYNSYYEGLKEYSEGKYGYFMTYEKLIIAFQNNPDLDVNVLHAYYWDHPKHTIKNVSFEIRNKLKSDLEK